MSRDAALLLGRLALVAIFPISAYFKIIGWPTFVGMLEGQLLQLAERVVTYGTIVFPPILPLAGAFGLLVDAFKGWGLPLETLGGYLAIVTELGAAAAVILGVLVRPAAIALMLYTAATALIAHRFWEFTGPAQFGQLMSFMKNLAMIGGLGIVAAIGPGRFALRP